MNLQKIKETSNIKHGKERRPSHKNDFIWQPPRK